MTANWTAADLEAMEHRRGLPRESVHGQFTTRDVVVDLLPGLPPMMTDEGTGSFTGHEFTVSGKHATMILTPSRRVQANDLVFTVPDTTPRAIVDASAHAHMTGTADALADLIMREPLRRQAGLAIDPATVKGQAEGDLALDLKLGKTARPEDTQFHATGSLANLEIDKFVADEKLDSASAVFTADRNSLKVVGDGDLLGAPTHVEVARAPGEAGSATVTFALDAAARAKRGLNFSVAYRAAADQAQGAPDPRERRGRNRPHSGGRRQFRAWPVEACGKARQGDLRRQARAQWRFAQQYRHRHGRADDARVGPDRRRRRHSERDDHVRAHRAGGRFQG